jgi:hypothetical protein
MVQNVTLAAVASPLHYVRMATATRTVSIQFDLAPEERLLWSGVPRQGLLFRPGDLLMVPFSLVWAAGAVYWETLVVGRNAPLLFKLWGVPFLFVAVYITFGRFIFDAWRRARTAYGVTTQRVIIASRNPLPSLKSLDLATLPTMALTERPDGTGTITFGASTAPWGTSTWSGPPRMPAFEAIPAAKAVYEQIRSAGAAFRAPVTA